MSIFRGCATTPPKESSRCPRSFPRRLTWWRSAPAPRVTPFPSPPDSTSSLTTSSSLRLRRRGPDAATRLRLRKVSTIIIRDYPCYPWSMRSKPAPPVHHAQQIRALVGPDVASGCGGLHPPLQVELLDERHAAVEA